MIILMKSFRGIKYKKARYFLNAAGSSSSETIGNVISKMDRVILN